MNENCLEKLNLLISAGKIPWWQGETIINNLYENLLKLEQRIMFMGKVSILKINDEYELFFRQQFNEIFSKP